MQNFEISEQEWFDMFRPQPHHLGKGEAPGIDDDYYGYETFGDDLEYVESVDPARVWTYHDNCSILSGFHFINRSTYIICDVPVVEGEAYEVDTDPDGEFDEEIWEFYLTDKTDQNRADVSIAYAEGYRVLADQMIGLIFDERCGDDHEYAGYAAEFKEPTTIPDDAKVLNLGVWVDCTEAGVDYENEDEGELCLP